MRDQLEVFDAGEEGLSRADRGQVERAREVTGQGLTIPQACKRIGISDQSIDGPETRPIKGRRGPAAQSIGAGEPPSEANRRRLDARHLDAEGPAKVKMVSPFSTRTTWVAHGPLQIRVEMLLLLITTIRTET